VLKHGRTILLDVFVQPQARRRTCEHTGERGLPHVQRVAAQVLTIELDQVEGIEEYTAVMLPMSDAIEQR
jgi:hypothetical protein